MFNNLEDQDKRVRDILEGPPQIEVTENFESVKYPENSAQSINAKNEQPEKQSKNNRLVTKENAHKIALSLISNNDFIGKFKDILKEKLARGEKITRLDEAIADRKVSQEPYGLSRQHLVEALDKNFFNFNIVRDGNECAISFTKKTGDAAIRPLDDAVLAEILNRIIKYNPDLEKSLADETEKLSTR
jgi:hypothetical protein